MKKETLAGTSQGFCQCHFYAAKTGFYFETNGEINGTLPGMRKIAFEQECTNTLKKTKTKLLLHILGV